MTTKANTMKTYILCDPNCAEPQSLRSNLWADPARRATVMPDTGNVK